MEIGNQILIGIAAALFIIAFFIGLIQLSHILGKAKDWIKRMIFLVLVVFLSCDEKEIELKAEDSGDVWITAGNPTGAYWSLDTLDTYEEIKNFNDRLLGKFTDISKPKVKIYLGGNEIKETTNFGSIKYIDSEDTKEDPDSIIIGEPDEEPFGLGYLENYPLKMEYPITFELMEAYAIECYNDSIMTCSCDCMGGLILMGCTDEDKIWCKTIQCNVKYLEVIHKEPTFIGFINWIKSKL